jgi:hypothetical protein
MSYTDPELEKLPREPESDLIDVGSNLGGINRAMLGSSGCVVIPLAPAPLSLQMLRSRSAFAVPPRRTSGGITLFLLFPE